MKRGKGGLIKNRCYLWLVGVIVIGLITMVGSGGGGGGGNGGEEISGGGNGGGGSSPDTPINYRKEMRDFVQGISSYARGLQPGFIIIPQNGHELLTENGEETGTPASDYIHAIDGVGREDLFFGYNEDNVPTPESEREYMIAFMDRAELNGIEVLVTDYCWTEPHVDYSYEQNADKGYISFAADHRELDNIPVYPATPFNVNSADVYSLMKS